MEVSIIMPHNKLTTRGCGLAIGREVADDHYARCIYAGIKISGMNGEVLSRKNGRRGSPTG